MDLARAPRRAARKKGSGYENERSSKQPLCSFSYPEPFLRAVRRGALAKSISELASDWLVLAQDIVFLPCFHGIRLWIWPEPLVAPSISQWDWDLILRGFLEIINK